MVNQHKTVCHSEEGIKFIIEEKLCSESYQQIGTNKSYWYLKSKKMLKRVQHDTNFFVKKYAFTLAEVLITLSILGVVAAIMIPSTIQRVTDISQITAAKRAYSIIENALYQMNIIEGNITTWNLPGTLQNNSDYFAEKLSKYLNVRKYCGSSRCSDYGYTCIGSHKCYKNLDGRIYNSYTDDALYGKMILNNNMILSTSLERNHTTDVHKYIGSIKIDTNGIKGPNRLGYDVFIYFFNEKGINGNELTYYNQSNCNITTNNYMSGWSCIYWIMRHNNMDYKYRDVSAEW